MIGRESNVCAPVLTNAASTCAKYDNSNGNCKVVWGRYNGGLPNKGGENL
jgi:hypothetical protein